MKKSLFVTISLSLAQIVTYAQEDTASVTYLPSLDIYLLQYNLLGVSYTDTLVPATRIVPSVKCSVIREGELYLFSYSASLSSTSQQHLSSFMVSHPAPVINPTKPNARWSQGEFAQYRIWDWANSLMDPSGLWTPTTDIAPGTSLGGFSFKSTGLPVIVHSYFEGNAMWRGFTAEPPQLMYDLLDTVDVFPHNTVVRQTLGPKDPPALLNGLGFLDSVKSYINDSRTLGWITSDTTATKYRRLIDSARANLQEGRLSVTMSKLDSVLMNVVADSGSVLTSEAYALIRFNTEYLITHLK